MIDVEYNSISNQVKHSDHVEPLNNLRDLLDAIRKLEEVYFSPHCRNKKYWSDSRISAITKRMREAKGEFYWDQKHRNVRFYNPDDNFVFPFGIDDNTNPDQDYEYFYCVSTCFQYNGKQHELDRFRRLYV